MHTVTVKFFQREMVLTHDNVAKLMTYDFQGVFNNMINSLEKKKTLSTGWYEKLLDDFITKIESDGFKSTTERVVQLY